MESPRPPSSGVSASSDRYASISSRCSSGLCTLGLLLELDEELLDPRVDFLEPRDQVVVILALLELCDQRLRRVQVVLERHAASSSLATRASTPLTNRPASSDAYRFASLTASPMATSTGTLAR